MRVHPGGKDHASASYLTSTVDHKQLNACSCAIHKGGLSPRKMLAQYMHAEVLVIASQAQIQVVHGGRGGMHVHAVGGAT